MLMSKKLKKRVMSIVMCLILIAGMMPTSAIETKAAAADVKIDLSAKAAGDTIASVGKATFKASQALAVSDRVTSVGDADYTQALKSGGVNNGKVGTSKARVFGCMTSEVDADLAVTYFISGVKDSYIFESDSELSMDASNPATFDAANAYEKVSCTESTGAGQRVVFTAKAGKFYYLVGVGTNLEVLNFEFVAEKVAPGNGVDFTYIMDENAVDGVVATGEKTFGDSKLLLAGQTVSGTITQYTVKSGKKVTINGQDYDSYTSGKRHADANNIPTLPGEGDGCLAVFTPAADGMFTVYYNSTSYIAIHDFNTADGSKNGVTNSEIGLSEYSFHVETGHSYVMSTTGKTNNMFYAGYQYIVDKEKTVNVNVTNVDATVSDGTKFTLVDAKLGGKEITVKEGSNSVKLLAGHTYKLASNDGGVKPLCNGEESFTVGDSDTVEITLNNVPDVTLSGNLLGTDASDIESLAFTNMTSGVAFPATITGDTYTVSLKPGEYNASVVSNKGGITYDRASVKANVENIDNVFVEYADPASKRDYNYASIPNMDTTGSVAVETGKTHTVAKQDATIKIPVSGQAKIVVKAYYAAGFTINDEAFTCDSASTSKIDTYEKVVDGDATITFTAPNSYLTGISVIPMHEFKSEINVPEDYATLNEASDAILGMTDRPEGEEGRVTINLNTDLFQQTVMAAPYVTLKGNGHTVSWYYGVGTKYYSVDPATGLYNRTLFMDKYSSEEGNGNLWGGVFIVRGDNFLAEDTTFKNTYNYEVTDLEKYDIAGSLLNGVDRLADGINVADYKYKERSNAFYIEANNVECYNCKILSSQDTLGRNGSANNGYHTYFRDCTIGGNVDYICGEFAAVFDNCELQWKTYTNADSKNNGIGYIVAPKTSPYVFRDCWVSVDGNQGDATVLGYLGRTWGAASNASYINLETNGYISTDGWGEMGSGEKASAIFNEYNLKNNGEDFSTTGYTNNTMDAVADYIDNDERTAVNTVLADWTPLHYPINQPEYEIIEGAFQELNYDDHKDLTVRSNAPFNKFLYVMVDDVEIASDNYTVAEGSTIVTLKDSYLDTLEAGEHKLTVVSNDGQASTTFIILKSEPQSEEAQAEDETPSSVEEVIVELVRQVAPSTGDASGFLLFMLLMATSATVLVASKKKSSKR